MFSSFFTCPLFTESATLRELNAVDSENSKNLQNDSWRKFQLIKSLAKEGHPLNAFATGNLETLKTKPESMGINIRDACIDWYKKYYSANLMKLVVYSSESLDVQQKWVEEKFSSIPNYNTVRPTSSPDAYGPNETSKLVVLVPIKDLKSIEMHFSFPPTEMLFKSKPTRYLSHLIGHEGKGSILAALKEKGWANGLSCFQYQSYQDFSTFSISITLTDEGVKNTDEIVDCVFAYIGMLRKEGPKEWIAEECKSIMDMDFRFISKSEPSSYAIQLANNQHIYPPELTIAGEQLIFEVDSTGSVPFLNQLTPENCIIICSHKGLAGTTDLKERWYESDYSLKNLTAEQISRWTKVNASWESLLHLPEVNPFVPTDFTIRNTAETVAIKPVLIDKKLIGLESFDDSAIISVDDVVVNDSKETSTNEISISSSLLGNLLHNWFIPDNIFLIPKLNIIIMLESLYCNATPLNVAFTELLCDCIKENMIEYAYYADCAGLYHDVKLEIRGMELVFYGYQEKIPVLLNKAIAELQKLCSDAPCKEALFKRLKETKLRSYYNMLFSQPYSHCINGSGICLEEPKFYYAEKHAALSNASLTEFHAFCSVLIRNMSAEVFVHGNANEEEAKKIAADVITIIGSGISLSLEPCRRVVSLDSGMQYTYRQHCNRFNKAEENSAIENIYMVNEYAGYSTPSSSLESLIRTEALTELVAHLLSEPAFDQLRTKEQLGYIVFTGVKNINSLVIAIHLIVQSNHKDPQYLDERIEDFLVGFKKLLLEYTETQINENIEAVKDKLLEKPKNLNEGSRNYWSEIKSRAYLFGREKLLAEALTPLTLNDIIEFYDTYLSSSSSSRQKFSSQCFGAKTSYPTDVSSPGNVSTILIDDPNKFKRMQPMKALPLLTQKPSLA